MTNEIQNKKIREYWEIRARESAGDPSATTRDKHLRDLEIRTIIETVRELQLPAGASVLDLGCGDGYATLRIAAAFPEASFTGIDFAEHMVRNAVENLKACPLAAGRATFLQGDTTRLKEACGDARYDVILTDRCLINLESQETQYDAIRQIAEQLKPGGTYIAIENFVEGHNNMNEARAAMGLSPILIRWHNRYFSEDIFFQKIQRFFEVAAFKHFSSAYYYATRVLYSALCREQNEEPDYDHPIHRRAVDLPWTGRFSPICMAVMCRRHRFLSADTKSAQSIVQFEKQKNEHIAHLGSDENLRRRSFDWIADVSRHKYSYNFTWLGRPIIQFPQDMIALQELIWNIKPDLIVETGIAHGGSLILSASILEMIGGEGHVLGIDIDIRPHNRMEIEKHPLFKRIEMIEGSSTDEGVARQVRSRAQKKERVLVILDSNHTHEHVLKELNLYSPLVTKDSYLIVFDTIIEYMPDDLFQDRPWGKGNNPKTAVNEFLDHSERFVIDTDRESKMLITVAPGGYLRCTAD